MDGISRASGAPVPVEFEGEEYLLDPLGAVDYGTIENYLLSVRPNVIDVATQAAEKLMERAQVRVAKIRQESPDGPLDQSVNDQISQILAAAEKAAEKLIEKSFDEARKVNTVSALEVHNWLDTPDGLAFCYWLSFEKRYPGRFKRKRMMEVINELFEKNRAKFEELMRKRDEVSTLGPLGNSTSGQGEPTLARSES